MDKLPTEILRHIGSFLVQISQKECALVCKSWLMSFQPLVFQKAVLTAHSQYDTYMAQDPSLRRLTTSIHFAFLVEEDLLERIAQESPNINTITLFTDSLTYVPVNRIVAIFEKYWLKNLIKIRLDSLLLSRVLPLLAHQLQDVTGGFDAFFDKEKKLIPMPQLKILDTEQDEEEILMCAKRLNEMRIAYPKLQELTLSYFELVRVEDPSFTYIPFPLVRAFHLVNCNDMLNSFPQFKKMFTDLKYFSFLRTLVPEIVELSPSPYRHVITDYLNLKELKLDYMNGMSQGDDGFPVLKHLSNLTFLQLERSFETSIITKRELFDFDLLLSSAPKLKKLQMAGLFHLSTGESFDNYLCGTVGFCDAYETDLTNHRDIEIAETISLTTEYVGYHPANPSEYNNLFGDGEHLYKSNTRITTVKKRMPILIRSEPVQIYSWNENKPYVSRTIDATLSRTIYPLTFLRLDSVTLRNPTYQWIARHLPHLETFFVFDSEPYPYCDIILGDKINLYQTTFNDRYTKFGAPLIFLKDTVSEKARVAALHPERKVFEAVEPLQEMRFSSYAIRIRFNLDTCNALFVSHRSLNSVLVEMSEEES